MMKRAMGLGSSLFLLLLVPDLHLLTPFNAAIICKLDSDTKEERLNDRNGRDVDPS